MANITYSNADKRNGSYSGRTNSGIITQDRQRMEILKMLQNDPAMGAGYLLGSAIGKKYWGDKQAKSRAEANFMTLHPDATKDQFNQYYDAIKSGASRNDALAKIGFAPMREYGQGDTGGIQVNRDANGNFAGVTAGPQSAWAARDRALETIKNGGGNILYSGMGDNGATVAPSADNIPRTPQQSNASGVTMNNAGVTGGVETPQQAYQNMANGVSYNNGNTPTGYAAVNGVRDQGNVMQGASTPSLPEVPHVDPSQQGSSSHGGGGGLLSAVANAAAQSQAQVPAANEAYDYVPGYTNPQDMETNPFLKKVDILRSLGSLFTRNPQLYSQ